jgi:excisionase family DNA binding protein
MRHDEPRAATTQRAAAETVRLHRVPEAMRLLSMSRSVIYEQIRAGRLRSVTQGRTRLIPATAIADYIDLLLQEADDGAA